MGIFKSQKEILVIAYHHYHVDAGRFDGPVAKRCAGAFYLHAFLKTHEEFFLIHLFSSGRALFCRGRFALLVGS